MIKNQNKECFNTSKSQAKQKKVRSGKVIRFFTVEAVDAESDPVLKSNPSNPYAQLSEEERMRDLIEMFGILWAETCREKAQRDKNKIEQ